jgi:hypothetical protein
MAQDNLVFLSDYRPVERREPIFVEEEDHRTTRRAWSDFWSSEAGAALFFFGSLLLTCIAFVWVILTVFPS